MRKEESVLNKTFNKKEVCAAAVGKLKIYFLSSAVLAVAAALVRSLAVFLAYDTDPGYFREGLLPSLSKSLTIVTFIIIMSAFVFLPKDLPAEKFSDSGAGYFISTMFGFMCLFEAAYRFYRLIQPEMLETLKNAFARDELYSGRRLARISAVIAIAMIAAAAGSAACFFIRSASEEKNAARKNAVIILGTFPMLRVILAFAELYFDQSTVMNGSSKIICESAFVLLIFFFICESRLEIGGQRALPRAYAVTGLASMMLSFTASVSVGFGWIAGKITGEEFMTESMFLLLAAIYSFVRTRDYIGGVYAAANADDELPEGEAAPAANADAAESEKEPEKSDDDGLSE